MADVNGSGYAVDWSVPPGVNRLSRSSARSRQRAAQPVAAHTLAMEGYLVVSETRFIDSGGFDALLRARRHLATIGNTILLRSPHQRVLKVLEISGLGRVFPIGLETGPNVNDRNLSDQHVREGPRA